ncbi:MAG: FKBP-type peptidyl-prolyl cis-trans isomerase [Sphingomonadaceae bacterium]|nr:FKBP-type peptidyl-prolyl cis-trans isomerase [Sphingomonadaceae bacterium]
MAEITRVPLQPIQKGSLSKLWLGVIVAILLGAGIAWASVPKGVSVTELTAGTGDSPAITDVALINYTGKLADGTIFDEGQATPLKLDSVIPGFTEGLLKMKKGGKYRLEIPSEKAYGAEGGGPIPPNSDLIFEVELIDFMDGREFEQRMQMMQQMMGPQGPGGPGAPGDGSPIPVGPPPGQ